jgi:propionyl-CoA carboxylase alpha chain
MARTAALPQEDLKINGWAMESRLYAEDPYRNFLPSIGRLTRYRPPVEGKTDRGGGIVRNDTGVYEGGEISMFYDPMIAKLCTWAPTRAEAIEEMRLALDTFEVEGIGHNLPFVGAVMDHPRFHRAISPPPSSPRNIPTAFRAPRWMTPRCAGSPPVPRRDEPGRRNPPHRISGTMDNHQRRVGDDWVVSLQGRISR